MRFDRTTGRRDNGLRMSWKRVLLLLAAGVIVALALACGDDDEESVPGDDNGSAATVTDAPIGATTAPAVSDCPPLSGDAPEVQMKSYPNVPEMMIDAAKTYTAVVHTERGDFTMNLRADLAPQHVNSFVFLAREGYFDGVTFHRVLPGFVAQTGDPTGSGSGGPGYLLPAEFTTEVNYTRGTVGMARTNDPNSAGSQWFVTYGDAANLNGAYTIFAEVTDGMDVVDCITPRDPSTNPGAPAGDKIIGIDITES
jgi:peptidylprolyl isomerase